MGHRRSATGQEADQTPQDEHHAKGEFVFEVLVCHVGGSSCSEYLEAGCSRVRTAFIVFDLGLLQGL